MRETKSEKIIWNIIGYSIAFAMLFIFVIAPILAVVNAI